jgi:MoxR-like ATPase
MFESLAHVDSGLRGTGYIADPTTVSTVYLAAALHRPLLLEGVAGSGKTQLAYAVAEAAHTESHIERAIGFIKECQNVIIIGFSGTMTTSTHCSA